MARVVVHAPVDVTLPRVLAVDEAVDGPQVGLALDPGSGQPHLPLCLLRLGLDGLFAVFGAGVRGKPGRHAAAVRLRVHPLERFEKARHLRGIVARLRGVFHGERVGLPLVVAAVFHEKEPHPDLCQARQQGHAEHLGDDHPDLRHLRFAQLLGRVPCRDVADLVPHDAGQFRLAVEGGQDPPREEEIAPGGGEGVHDRGIEDLDAVVELRAVGELSQPAAHVVHIGGEARVVVEAVLLGHRGIDLPAHVDFFLLADQHEVLLAADGVGGAGRKRDDDADHKGACGHGGETSSKRHGC